MSLTQLLEESGDASTLAGSALLEDARVPSPDESRAGDTPMDFPRGPGLIVTIDGPAGTGKSSVARALALRLGLDFLDTGAMYRAASAVVLDGGTSIDDADAVVRVISQARIAFDFATDPPTLTVNGVPMTRRVREPDVESIVSAVASIPAVRHIMVAHQRRIAREHPRLVTEGRDQGSVVFQDAPVKFYLDAAPEVRAVRRAEQLRRAGIDADERTILSDIIRRDRSDSSRSDGPLCRTQDAVLVDTSWLPFEQVVETLEEHVRRIASIRGLSHMLRAGGHGNA
jgi:cytidylate kinase